MQINWTLVGGLAAFSLAAAASWDAGTADPARRRRWRLLSLAYLAMLAELVAEWRFGAVAAVMRGSGMGRHAAQIGLMLVILTLAAGALLTILRTARQGPVVAMAAMVALASAMLFAVEMLSLQQIGALLYRPMGPVMGIAWLWLAGGAAAVALAVAAVRGAKAT